jgi:hypothetical protein
MDIRSGSDFQHVAYTDEHKARFYQTLKEAAKLFGCHYISYVYEEPRNGLRIGFSTNPDWEAHYMSYGLIHDCHLWKTVLKYFINTARPVYILPWDSVSPESEAERHVVHMRDSFNIGRNGISFCARNENKREFLAFAPGSQEEKGFAANLLNNMDSVRCYAKIFRDATQEALQTIQLGAADGRA